MDDNSIDALFNAAHSMQRNDSIANYLSNLGRPGVDSGATARPIDTEDLQPHELEFLYRKNDLTGVIVDEIVDESLRRGYRVAVDGDTENTDPCETWTKNLFIPETVAQAAKWGRLYGAGFVLIVLEDGLDPIAPVETDKIQSILNLIDLDRYEITVERWNTDIGSEDYGRPEIFNVAPQSQGGTSEITRVHASRMLSFGGVKLPRKLRANNGGFDDSVMQRVWESVRRFGETENAIARIVQSFEISTFAISGLATILQREGGEQLIDARMKMLAKGVSLINTYLMDADTGEQMTRQSSNVVGLPEIRQGFAESVAKAARMPQTILFGAAPEGLNTDGESGIQSWHKSVRAYQAGNLATEFEKIYRYLFLSKTGPTNGVEPENWRIEFLSLDEPSELTKAELRHKTAETDAIYLDRGVRSPEQVAKSRDGAGGWSIETVAVDEFDEDLF